MLLSDVGILRCSKNMATSTMKTLEYKPHPCWPKHAHCNTVPTILLAGSHAQLLARAWYMVCTLVALNTCIGYNLVQQYQYYGCGFQFHFVSFLLNDSLL